MEFLPSFLQGLLFHPIYSFDNVFYNAHFTMQFVYYNAHLDIQLFIIIDIMLIYVSECAEHNKYNLCVNYAVLSS